MVTSLGTHLLTGGQKAVFDGGGVFDDQGLLDRFPVLEAGVGGLDGAVDGGLDQVARGEKLLLAVSVTIGDGHAARPQELLGCDRVDEDDGRDKRLAVTDRHDGLDDGGVVEGLLDFLRSHILAAVGLEETLGAAGDVQTTVVVDIAEVARLKPAVGGEGRLVVLGQLPVARRNDAAR